MDDTEDAMRRFANKYIDKLRQTEPCAVGHAVFTLIQRIQEAGETFEVLNNHAKHDWRLDACILLRTAYDGMLQALYILASKNDAESRGQAYLDFEWIERHNLFEKFDKSQTTLAKIIMGGPTRQKNEQAVRDKITSLLPSFTNAKGKPFKCWYAESPNLGMLADATGYREEYELYQAMMSGIVHSSSYWLRLRSVWSKEHYQHISLSLFVRVLGRFAEFMGIEICPEDKEVFAYCDRNILNFGAGNQ